MGKPAAKKGDQVLGTCTHTVYLTNPGPPPPEITAPVGGHAFAGVIDANLSSNVRIGGQPAAVVDSGATNAPPHIPNGLRFVNKPDDKATLERGSQTVNINGKAAVRNGDPAKICDELGTKGTVVAVGTVNIGD